MKRINHAARTALMLVLALILTACENDGNGPVTPVFPLEPNGAYADELKSCTREAQRQQSCTLQRLPILGMQYAEIGREQLYERAAVSHAWMGERFKQVMAQLPDDLLELSGSLSSVIIASDIRPSFYWRHTGAIYLDPAYLWLSVEEKSSIDPAPDFRQDFGNALNFRVLSRYVLGDDYAWRNYSLSDDSTRELADIIPAFARLLYHELAHANDFIPPEERQNLNASISIAEAINNIEDRQAQISQRLVATQPLQSQLMFDLAEVSFLGRDPDEQEQALSAADVSAEFAPGRANDDYNYLTPFEDMAMMFEETMMQKNFGIRRDFAICPTPQGPNATASEYIVEWGQRGRLAQNSVQPRAAYVAARLLPGEDFNAFWANLPEEQAMRSGADWIDNLDPDGDSAGSKHRIYSKLGLVQTDIRDSLPMLDH